MTSDKQLGKKGEELASDYLSRKGYKILHRNWIWNHKELDIVANQDHLLVIVEVKTRSNIDYERPQDAVTAKKQKHIVAATQAYMDTFSIEKEVRFDVISIIIYNDKPQITHIPDAFQPFTI